MTHSYKVNNLSLNFICSGSKRLKILENINFSIKEGEFVTILGPSGCGKTTLIRTIAGFIEPNKGSINFKGETIKEMRSKGLISYVPQHSVILPFLTIEKNISLPLEIRGINDQKSLNRLLLLFNLKRFTHYYSKQISGGMKKKVALARALVTKPKLILMDEPFSSLDEFTRENLNEELVVWKKKFNTTILFVTHDVEEAVFLSDRIIILSKRPAKVLGEIEVKLPKKRENNLREKKEFIKIVNKMRKMTRNF